MTKKKPHLKVDADLNGLFNREGNTTPRSAESSPTVKQALRTVTRQMEATGLRPRTISDYVTHVNHFTEVTGVTYITDIDADSIYVWLSSMDVSNQTKLTRLKCLKAFLGRCMDNGWLTANFWRSINVKVDAPVKQGATEAEVMALLSVLDLTDFVQLRDAVSVLLMYRTGLRVGTLAKLENRHVDLDERMLKIDGSLLKNHSQIYLPFGDDLTRLLTVLLRQNDMIRRANNVDNGYVFITKFGGRIASSQTHNNIQKRLNKYARQYGFKNISPHALRRGFAKSLLDKGADVAVISKALGHSSLDVTTRYLHLDKHEVADSLRKYL